MKAVKGFTLFESLIALSILALTFSLAIPSFSDSIQKHQASSDASALYHLALFARTSSISLNKATTLCASDDKTNCLNSNDWSGKTLIVFSDSNRNRILDKNDELLRLHQQEAEDSELLWRASFGRTYIQWLPNGTTNQNGTFYYCPKNKVLKNAKAIIINRGGRPYMGQDRNNDGIQENSQRKNLSC